MSKEWKRQQPETLRKEVERLVHFSAKTINSNAAAVGIRLAPEAALDLPYVSMRTLLGSGASFRLDYAEGGANTAGIVKQINWVLNASPESAEASELEKNVIVEAMQAGTKTGYLAGTEHVDHRLRQILVPNADAPEGYVSLTPITASSLCAFLFDAEQGLVTKHNAVSKENKDNPNFPKKRLQQAQFGIGGSNPQNVGSLVRSMQRPLLLSTPRRSGHIRHAYKLYYQAITFEVHKAGAFRNAVLLYVDFRKKTLLAGQSITMHEREQEEQLIRRIATVALDMAAEVHNILSEHAHNLPQENWLSEARPPRYALVSAKQPKEIQGLIEPELRSLCDNWPRLMARHLTNQMTQAHPEIGRLLLLDTPARAHVEGILEEVLR